MSKNSPIIDMLEETESIKPIIDLIDWQEIQFAEARKIAKDMAHIRECLKGHKELPFSGKHEIGCPYWEIKR